MIEIKEVKHVFCDICREEVDYGWYKELHNKHICDDCIEKLKRLSK